MTHPRVPGGGETTVTLACGERIDPLTVDMGMRDLSCACGAEHAVVTDVHPPSRFLPESLVEDLRVAVETDDGFGEFGTPHLMGMVMEEFPDVVATADVSETGEVGYAVLWITDFESRRLHEVIVELVVEMMDHAVSHSPHDDTRSAFEEQMARFDVSTFVEQYRRERDFESEHDRPV